MWDLKLVAAYHIYQDFMRGTIPIYWDESDRVAFDVKEGKSKSRAKVDARERADQKAGKNTDGIYYYPVPRTIDGGKLPTMQEWLAEKAAKKGKDRGPGTR